MTPEPMTVSDQTPVRQHDDGLWEIGEVAKYLKVKKRTIWRYIKNGLPNKKVGRKVLFRRSEIDAWVDAQHRTDGSAEGAA